ncbi:MAG: histidine kinase [Bacteroidetes bacterium]|nr:histidine kinase [Bacteroidota bacterium]
MKKNNFLKENWLEIILHPIFWVVVSFYFVNYSILRPGGFVIEIEYVCLLNIIATVYINYFVLFKYLNKKGTRFFYWILTVVTIVISAFIEWGIVYPNIKHIIINVHIPKFFHIGPIALRNSAFMLFFIIVRYYKESVMYSRKLVRMFEIERLYLSSRIAPHYFSNVIFSMQNLLMTADRDTFKYQLEKLEHVISYMLVDAVKSDVTLKEEIRFYSSYVELEKLRHASEINYIVNTANGVDFMFHMAPLLYENLICNAFKFCPHDGTGYVKVTIEQPDPNSVLFTCENNISGTIINRKGNGKGLPNLQNRLELMYPKKHTLDFINLEHTFIAKLLIQK